MKTSGIASDKKAQASLEYMVMLAISLLIFTTIIAFSINMVNNVKNQLGVDAAFKAVEEIKEASDFIYVHGNPSKVRRNVRIPPNVGNITLLGNLIKVGIDTGPSYTDIYDVTKSNITIDEDTIEYLCPTDSDTLLHRCKGGNFVLNIESIDEGDGVKISAG